MNVSNSKLEILEQLWGSYFYKKLQNRNMHMGELNILKVP